MLVFNREAENAQRAYDAAMQRAVQTHMESEMSQTNTTNSKDNVKLLLDLPG